MSSGNGVKEAPPMAAFKDLWFTPDEFARIAKIERAMVSSFETKGILHTTKRKVGNVERKMISLEDS